MKRFTVWTYHDAGFGHGWLREEADAAPDGAVLVPAFDGRNWDKSKVYALDSQAPGGAA